MHHQAATDPSCLAASPCIQLHTHSRIGLYTSDCGETVEELLVKFKDHPELEFSEPNYLRKTCSYLPVQIRTPDDPRFSDQWSLNNTRQQPNSLAGVDINYLAAQKLLKHTLTNAITPIVAVIDSGFDVEHPDLKHSLWINPGEIPGNGIDDDENGYIDDIHGYDFINNTGDLNQTSAHIAEHGTHVAGIIAAQTDNGIGISGVASQIKLICLRVSLDGETIDTDSTLRAYEYISYLKKNYDIPIIAVNASYGGYTGYSEIEALSIHQLYLQFIWFCAAAGNDALNIDLHKHYPASYPLQNVIAVGATTPANQYATFSNYGTNTVCIAAPGKSILSTIPRILQPQLTVADSMIPAYRIHNTQQLPHEALTATLIDCGIGAPTNFPNEVAGNIAFIQRGTLTFKDKINNASEAGAIAAIIYNNDPQTDDILFHDQWYTIENAPLIPAVAITYASAQAPLSAIHAAPIASLQGLEDPIEQPYDTASGTSQATPHVSASIALLAKLESDRFYLHKLDITQNGYTNIPALDSYLKNGAFLDLLRLLDTDQDLLPDWWERQIASDIIYMESTSDKDHDGWNALQEYHGNSHPNLTLSVPETRTLLDIKAKTQCVSLPFDTFPEWMYTLQFSSNLTDWIDITAPYRADGNRITVEAPLKILFGTDYPYSPFGYYRLSILPNSTP